MSEEKEPGQLDITDEMIAEGRSYTGVMPDDMPKYMAKTILGIDLFSLRVGLIACWLTVPVFVSMFYEVVARHFFSSPTFWAYDISRMFAGAMFMLGAGYALSKGVHIRADFMYRNWSIRTQATIDLTLYILFYFPGLIGASWACYKYAYKSWSIMERSMDTSWMPLMYPIKFALFIGLVLLIIQGVSETLKCVYAVKNRRWP
ncbi:MAG: TRAP transporter small permease subunit [Candidatus Pseudothioglobus sp.]|jgi:TRAP-type mannitol/chloroaromatic compound transport system permease small subunit